MEGRIMGTKTKKQVHAPGAQAKSTSVKPPSKRKGGEPTQHRPYSDLERIRFVVDGEGNRLEAVIPIDVFDRILDDLEDLEDIQDAHDAKQEMEGEAWIPLEDVLTELNIDVSSPAE